MVSIGVDGFELRRNLQKHFAGACGSVHCSLSRRSNFRIRPEESTAVVRDERRVLPEVTKRIRRDRDGAAQCSAGDSLGVEFIKNRSTRGLTGSTRNAGYQWPPLTAFESIAWVGFSILKAYQ